MPLDAPNYQSRCHADRREAQRLAALLGITVRVARLPGGNHAYYGGPHIAHSWAGMRDLLKTASCAHARIDVL
jgi:hypothetical protein